MTNNLYLCGVISPEPIFEGGHLKYEYRFRGFKTIVVASSEEEAKRKVIRYSEESQTVKNLNEAMVKVLTTEQDVPLEKRVEILGEVLTVVK